MCFWINLEYGKKPTTISPGEYEDDVVWCQPYEYAVCGPLHLRPAQNADADQVAGQAKDANAVQEDALGRKTKFERISMFSDFLRLCPKRGIVAFIFAHKLLTCLIHLFRKNPSPSRKVLFRIKKVEEGTIFGHQSLLARYDFAILTGRQTQTSFSPRQV